MGRHVSKTTIAADQFIIAVGEIMKNCGPQTRALLFSERLRLMPADIMAISRMAPSRQRCEMEKLRGRADRSRKRKGGGRDKIC